MLFIEEDTVGEFAADVASIRETLRKNGYSEKAIEAVLNFYVSSPKVKMPQEKK